MVTPRSPTMSTNQPDIITHHAMLVTWGQFAQAIGFIQKIEAIDLRQKKVEHSPQTKILEFLLSILAGLPHLQDLSRSAHPIDQDRAVAKAWKQENLADYSGVSRTLSQLSQAEADQVARVIEQITKPILAEEVMLALKQTGRLVYDGDLTDRPVSNTSTTYPGVAYGHMSDGLHLGYQAAMVSLHSPTYGRFWLSVLDHPGDTVSCTQQRHWFRQQNQRLVYVLCVGRISYDNVFSLRRAKTSNCRPNWPKVRKYYWMLTFFDWKYRIIWLNNRSGWFNTRANTKKNNVQNAHAAH
jgi:hypothetical protein